MGHNDPRHGDAPDREGPAPQVARSHRAGRLGLRRQGERAGEREQRRGGQRPGGAEARGTRRPAGGGYGICTKEGSGRPGGAAAGQAAMAGRLAPAAEAQSWPRRSALGARRSYFLSPDRQLPTTSHNSVPLPRRSLSAPRSFSGIHGTPLTGTNHIDLLRHCKYGCFNCKNKSIYIKDCVFLPLAYPLDPPAQTRHGTAPAPCRETG